MTKRNLFTELTEGFDAFAAARKGKGTLRTTEVTLKPAAKVSGLPTQIKTTQRYSHLTQDTLLDASNAVTRAVGHLFVPMVSASPATQVQ